MTLSNRVCYLRMSSTFAGKGRRWSAGANLLLGMAAIGCLLGLSCGPVRGEHVAEEKIPDPVQPLYVMDADGGNLQSLVSLPDYTACGSPKWCPDGTKIAFDAWKAHEGEDYRAAHVVVVNADGSSPQDLGPGAMPCWSPGGNRIAFSQYSPNRGVWFMYADGSDRKLLDPSGWGVRWSPDGRKLAWTTYSNGANITVYDLIEGNLHTVLEGEHRRYSAIYWAFGWSPDSKRLCFKGTSQGGEELVIVNVAGSSHGLKVRLQAKTGSNIAWHPDGKQIAFYKSCPERKCQQVYVMDADSEEPPTLLEGQDPERANTDATWSPDGEKILFSSKEKPPSVK